MKVYRIFLLSLVGIFLLGGLAYGGTTTIPCEQTSFTLLYSSNVLGEYAPCG